MKVEARKPSLRAAGRPSAIVTECEDTIPTIQRGTTTKRAGELG
jgi:hypothetical protein